ncbi:putative transcriptional regulatory protein-like protein [Emericellopsis cladophorae]|uniref:Transcriptional regulatory protein-like protein n=1 Tax=Emericellopsis cladophorae TaxID=2686198 RepID=A0A9Q0BDQ0_9HYPO|nr:putative transcriptional regulatory protein-like protein [Emericellopsis cladophorae]KAI6782117.1 putative transcriptional regulatory protein-like protein [Emericellopsis cladophorae]
MQAQYSNCPQNQQIQNQQQPNPQQPLDPAAVKLTRGTSCVLCQQRKQPRRRKKRLQEKDLIDRLKKYEGMLSEHGVRFEPIGQDLRSDGPQGDDVEDLESEFHALKASPHPSLSPSAASTGERPSSSIFALHKEFRASEKLIQDSSDEEVQGSTIHRAFDKLFSNEDGFPFIVGGSFISVTKAHPNPIQIFQLWQIYIDNINSLLKITHVPTIQPQILQAVSNLETAPKNIESLMFGIYLMAITSMEEREAQNMFNEPKQDVLKKYLTTAQQALVNASFMRVDDLLCLQAFVLYLFTVRWFVDPRQIFCMNGMAVRMAQRMGLHRDPGGYRLPPFEVEQRRRLWWTIVGYDRRIGEMTGSTVTALSSGGDCKMPLNVNDSDLHVDGKDMPNPHTGPTEMIFALARIEMSMAVASNSNRDSQKINSPEPKASSAKGDSKPSGGPTIRLAVPDSPTYTLDGFCAHMEGTYLSQCDSKIPLHFFTITMTRQALCKMRVVNFLVRMHNAEAMPLKGVEREDLFLQATQMIEYDNVVQSSDSLIPFKWYSRHHFPFPAYMFLVQELRTRVLGPMVERAWDAITANYDLRGLLNNFHNPMHMAFKNTFIKAWDAHAAALSSQGKHAPVPRFIVVLQERAEQRRRERADKQSPLDQSPGNSLAGIGPVSNAGSEKMTMTPPGMPGVGVPMPPLGRPGPPDDDRDMDWSHMVQGFQDPQPSQFNQFGGFGGFGPPLGGGGGPMPSMGPPHMGASQGPGGPRMY